MSLIDFTVELKITLLPTILSTFVHKVVSVPCSFKEYNQTSVLLMSLASIETDSLFEGFVIVKSPLSSTPCLKWQKNPVLGLELPLPSSLWIKLKGLPTCGACSCKLSSLKVVDTISKSKLCPFTLLLKAYTGVSIVAVLNLYWAVGIESMVLDLIGFPNFSFSPNPAFSTLINCSYQFAFPESFQDTVWFARFKLLLSIIFSVVAILVTFSKPFPAWFRVTL